MDRKEKIQKLRRLWDYFGTLDCTRERKEDNLVLQVEFVFTCDVNHTEELFNELGLKPVVDGKKISIKASFPADILKEAGIKEKK